MQELLNELVTDKPEQSALIFPMLPTALSNVPFHQNTRAIRRYFAESFPLHLAVHEVSELSAPPARYTHLHVHHDHDEINIIIGKQNLQYKIEIGDEEFIVNNNSCIWIPRGRKHSANVLRGAGYFITIRID